uniref:Neutral phospholipase A2 paradoxin-like beta chain n=1 Tax=Oxyuranus microlepidotus TaxID=111177 RepID=PA2HB_OXYMI|nr:RecName: Full=Neutral phospholipase A2 paradoxin-like beta chain; Short=svPLA2; AltName: Full=Beta paradoxin-like; Flags: Precursor [Oxyuranus microlepidotus]AAZ22638.1 beta paradoxin-like precursor [Oxyuranus microlepidotus]
MHPAHLLVLLAVCVSLLGASDIPPLPLNLLQFGFMIECAIRNRQPALDFMNYGCYCGTVGHGTPVDDLDRCCKTRNECYAEAEKHGCYPSLTTYRWQCGRVGLHCNSKTQCEVFVCACDLAAAKCLAQEDYNPAHFNINTKARCR